MTYIASRSTVASGALLLVAACGGGGGETDDGPQVFSTGDENATFTTTEGTGSIRMRVVDGARTGTFPLTDQNVPGLAPGTAALSTNDRSRWAALAAVTGGPGEAITTFGAGQLFRDGTPDLPSTGDATYAGSYIGHAYFSSSEELRSTVVGDAIIRARFDSPAVSGEIDNRRTNTGGAYPYPPSLVLQTAPLSSDGVARGTVARGDTPSGAPIGSFDAIMTGDNGQHVVGTLDSSYVVGGTSVVEYGAFHATD